MVHVLLVVSRDVPGLFTRLTKEFAGVEGIRVVTDRRADQRRRETDPSGAERRRRDRRQPGADSRLVADGWTLADAVTDTDQPAPTVALLSHTDPRKVAELLDAIQTLSRELDLTRLLQVIMDKASRLLNADRSSLFVVDEDRAELWSKIAQGLEVREIRVPIGQGIAGRVAVAGERVNIPDAYADARFNQEVDRSTGYRTRSILCAPVRDRSGRIVAVLQLLNRLDGAPFDADDERLLEAFVGQVAIALRNAQQMELIEERRRTSELLLDVMKSFSPSWRSTRCCSRSWSGPRPCCRPTAPRCSWSTARRARSGPRSPRAATWSRSGCPSVAASPARWRPPVRPSTSPTPMPMRASTRRSTAGPATAPAPSCARRSATVRARWWAWPRC
jgi:putative methionine-R-sulfoxide reductase with GAF domain